MKAVFNKVIPFKGWVAINLFGILFVRGEKRDLSQRLINHESIHTAQMRELLYIGFYAWYVIEWLFRLLFALITLNKAESGKVGKHFYKAYSDLSFEKEAYNNQDNFDYLATRKHFASFSELKIKTPKSNED